MTLYELQCQYNELMNLDLEEDVFADTLESLEGEITDKLCNIGRVVRNIEAEANAIEAEEKRLYAKRKALTKRVEHLKAYALSAMVMMDKHKVNDGVITWSTQLNPPKVIVDPDADIPLCWYVEKVERNLDKNAIKQALVSGATVPGCTLVAETGIRLK